MNEIRNIRRLQLIELNILKEMAAICDKHNLTYYLSEGTLLGAIRHGGFIPWDDDVDVSMPREDYEVFARIAPADLPKYMSIVYYRNSGDEIKDRSFFIHPCDNRYKIMWKMECDQDVEELPIWIDVAPLDGLPVRGLSRTIHLLHMRFLHIAARCSIVQQISTDRDLIWWKKIGIILAQKMRLDKLNTKKCYEKFDAAAKSYSYKDADKVINYASEYRKIAFRSWYGEGRKVKFEDAEFRIPNEAEVLLTQEYGDYMTLPPISERTPKHVYSLHEISGGG